MPVKQVAFQYTEVKKKKNRLKKNIKYNSLEWDKKIKMFLNVECLGTLLLSHKNDEPSPQGTGEAGLS